MGEETLKEERLCNQALLLNRQCIDRDEVFSHMHVCFRKNFELIGAVFPDYFMQSADMF